MSLNWKFQRGGGGFKPKNPPWEEYGYFLEEHKLALPQRADSGKHVKYVHSSSDHI